MILCFHEPAPSSFAYAGFHGNGIEFSESFIRWDMVSRHNVFLRSKKFNRIESWLVSFSSIPVPLRLPRRPSPVCRPPTSSRSVPSFFLLSFSFGCSLYLPIKEANSSKVSRFVIKGFNRIERFLSFFSPFLLEPNECTLSFSLWLRFYRVLPSRTECFRLLTFF